MYDPAMAVCKTENIANAIQRYLNTVCGYSSSIRGKKSSTVEVLKQSEVLSLSFLIKSK